MSAQTSWTLDPAHSHVLFSIRHLGISTVRGSFGGLSGTASFDPSDIKSLKLHVDIQASSVDTGNAQRDDHLRGADFLDVQNYPTITFEATRIEPTGTKEGKIYGELTIKGISKEIALHVEGPSPETNDPMGNVRIGAAATAEFNRKEFGISFNHVMEAGMLLIGEELKVTIDVEFTKLTAG